MQSGPGVLTFRFKESIIEVSLGAAWLSRSWILESHKPMVQFPGANGLRALAHRCIGQTICLYVVFARHVRNGEFKGAGQLAAGPMERIKTWAAANVLTTHLPDDHLRVGVDVQGLRLQRNGAL